MMERSDILYIKKIVHEAGTRAHARQMSDFGMKRKDDRTIVTEVDYQVQDYLLNMLRERFKDAACIHEENFDRSSVRMDDNTLNFIIDPIDGTAMYSMRLPIWCVSVGVFKGLSPLYGFVYSPASGLFFYNDDEQAYLNDEPVHSDLDLQVDSETNIFYASEIHKSYRVSFPGKVRNLGSTALQAALIVDSGRNRTLAFVGRSYLWDWAGAIPIILKAGGQLKYVDGSELDIKKIVLNNYYLPDFLIAYSTRSFAGLKDYFIKL